MLAGASMLIALVLSMVQLPYTLTLARPNLPLLLLIYWVIIEPYRIGVTFAWLLGILLDVLYSTVFGQHAIAFCFVAFLAFMLHLRLRIFPMWQQMLVIFILVGMYQLMIKVIQGLVGDITDSFLYWLPSLTSAICWPILVWVMPFDRRIKKMI